MALGSRSAPVLSGAGTLEQVDCGPVWSLLGSPEGQGCAHNGQGIRLTAACCLLSPEDRVYRRELILKPD